uniref:Uncharacterized protein n=1 Tax=Glossina pallidipes TaxID=7398 RepID=A0A1A9ZDU6_GLOPL
MDNILLTPHRSKLGATDFLGSVANALDSGYATRYNSVEMIKGSEQHILSFLKNQTCILDSTTNIIKQDETVTSKQLTHIHHELSDIAAYCRDMSENDQRERLFRTYADLAVRLTLTSFTIQCTQKAILQVLMGIHHKKIGCLLLPLKQFMGELSRIIPRASPYACTL